MFSFGVIVVPSPWPLLCLHHYIKNVSLFVHDVNKERWVVVTTGRNVHPREGLCHSMVLTPLGRINTGNVSLLIPPLFHDDEDEKALE